MKGTGTPRTRASWITDRNDGVDFQRPAGLEILQHRCLESAELPRERNPLSDAHVQCYPKAGATRGAESATPSGFQAIGTTSTNALT